MKLTTIFHPDGSRTVIRTASRWGCVDGCAFLAVLLLPLTFPLWLAIPSYLIAGSIFIAVALKRNH